MHTATVVNGRLVNPTHIELDEPVSGLQGSVEVTLRLRSQVAATSGSLSDFLSALRPGTLARAEIDDLIHQEKDAWENDN